MSTSIPLPGQHRPHGVGDESSADPESVRAEVTSLLNQLCGMSDESPDSESLNRDAQLLDRAHEVLVRALTTVDKT